MTTAVPEPWASALLDRGLTHAAKPSIRALARAAGVGSPETVRQMIHGLRDSEVRTVEAVADALGKDRLEVSEWVGHARSVRGNYVVPDEVGLLTDEEQQAITLLIRAIARDRQSIRPRVTELPA